MEPRKKDNFYNGFSSTYKTFKGGKAHGLEVKPPGRYNRTNEI